MRDVRDALSRWMWDVLDARGWSAAAWARRAGVTATNVTRFLRDPANASLPGAETLAKLARAAGSEPRFLGAGPPPSIRVPVLTPVQVRAALRRSPAELADHLWDLVHRGGSGLLLDGRVSRRAFAVRIGSHHLNAAGVVPGDLVVVEPLAERPMRAGDTVVALDGDVACGYRCHPPHLVPVSTDPACVPVPCDEAEIAGVAQCLVRDLRSETAAVQVRSDGTDPRPNMSRRRRRVAATGT